MSKIGFHTRVECYRNDASPGRPVLAKISHCEIVSAGSLQKTLEWKLAGVLRREIRPNENVDVALAPIEIWKKKKGPGEGEGIGALVRVR